MYTNQGFNFSSNYGGFFPNYNTHALNNFHFIEHPFYQTNRVEAPQAILLNQPISHVNLNEVTFSCQLTDIALNCFEKEPSQLINKFVGQLFLTEAGALQESNLEKCIDWMGCYLTVKRWYSYL